MAKVSAEQNNHCDIYVYLKPLLYLLIAE